MVGRRAGTISAVADVIKPRSQITDLRSGVNYRSKQTRPKSTGVCNPRSCAESEHSVEALSLGAVFEGDCGIPSSTSKLKAIVFPIYSSQSQALRQQTRPTTLPAEPSSSCQCVKHVRVQPPSPLFEDSESPDFAKDRRHSILHSKAQ